MMRIFYYDEGMRQMQQEAVMLGNRLHQIRYLLPYNTASSLWLETFVPVLESVPQAEWLGDRLVIVPDYPPGAVPATTLELSRVDRPTVVLDTIGLVVIEMGGVRVVGWDSRDPVRLPAPEPVTPDHPPLEVTEIAARLRGHVIRVDHSGVEFPTARVPISAWERLLDVLGAAANLYHHPDVDTEMPFVLPASGDEFSGEIAAFGGVRVPKFELTYGYVTSPLLQFHGDTDLDRASLDALFPEPQGFNLPGVETFRSVYVAVPWPGVTLRLDLTYAMPGEPPEGWISGEWLVREGRRLRGHP